MEFLVKYRAAVISVALALTLTACGGSTEVQIETSVEPNHSLTPLELSTKSVVRIVGDATECGRREKGTGFVIGTDLVMTNAHVVAGVASPEIDGPTIRKALKGDVVYFDAVTDTALVKVPELGLPPLTVGEQLEADTAVSIVGYPSGNSQETASGSVVRTFKAGLFDIYNTKNLAREIYEVAADINPGNSGGPILDEQGVVHGMVFAKAPSKDGIGYVLLPKTVTTALNNAGSANTPLTTKCIAD